MSGDQWCAICGSRGNHQSVFHNKQSLLKQMDVLKRHQAWRRDSSGIPEDRLEMLDPKEIGEAIDAAIIAFEVLINEK